MLAFCSFEGFFPCLFFFYYYFFFKKDYFSHTFFCLIFLFFSCCSYSSIYVNLLYLSAFNFAFLFFLYFLFSLFPSMLISLFSFVALFPSWHISLVLFSIVCFSYSSFLTGWYQFSFPLLSRSISSTFFLFLSFFFF